MARPEPAAGLRFGTDGVRGEAFSELTETFVERLGLVAAELLGAPRFVVGRDTRESSPALAAALARGASRAGVEVVPLGVVATPVVSHACALWGCAGAMVSASHNEWSDNGVKLFAGGGNKLSGAVEAALVRRLAEPPAAPDPAPAGQPAAPGDLAAQALLDYERALADGIAGRTLAGTHIVVDTANGAASPYCADVLRRLGATVTAVFDQPDGRNINAACGSQHPQALQREVVRVGADLGLSFDGDADRLIAVDDTGAIVDGDRLMALFAVDMAAAGTLAKRTLVTTVMSNIGLLEAMSAAGIAVEQTPVGDRHVLEALDDDGLTLGGEQSGHIVFRHLGATGDGLRSGVHFADLVKRSGRTSSRLAAAAMTQFPQVLVNVAVPGLLDRLPDELAADVDAVARDAGERTRVLVRPSGTEPLVRVMVEAVTKSEADDLAARLVETVSRGLT